VAVHAQFHAGAGEHGESLVIGTVISGEQRLDHVFGGKRVVDGNVPTGVRLHDAIGATIVLGAIQVHDRPRDVRRQESGRVFRERIDLVRAAVAVFPKLLFGKNAKGLRLGRHAPTRMRHRD
jgi:hypothetical protein